MDLEIFIYIYHLLNAPFQVKKKNYQKLTWSFKSPKFNINKTKMENYWTVWVCWMLEYIQFFNSFSIVDRYVNRRKRKFVHIGPFLCQFEFLQFQQIVKVLHY